MSNSGVPMFKVGKQLAIRLNYCKLNFTSQLFLSFVKWSLVRGYTYHEALGRETQSIKSFLLKSAL